MQAIIEQFKDIVVQIATPYSTGTGFLLWDQHLIVTNEHVVRDNRKVVVHGKHLPKQMATVLFLDSKYDLAFLSVDPALKGGQVAMGDSSKVSEGDSVVAIGHPFGLEFSATQGIVSSTIQQKDDIYYFQHDAALNPGNSGGPLINTSGEVIGVNTFIIQNGNNVGFSLPIHYVLDTIRQFKQMQVDEAVRCPACSNFVGTEDVEDHFCRFCGSKIEMPSMVDLYEPLGVSATVENMLGELNYDVDLSRRGPNHWEVQKGSATITISYYEKTGLIIGDAYLCKIPKEKIKKLYTFLLQQNYEMEGLTFSVKENDVILSLLIYDQYLNTKTALHLFNYLFEKADELDNVLVEEFGAKWREVNN